MKPESLTCPITIPGPSHFQIHAVAITWTDQDTTIRNSPYTTTKVFHICPYIHVVSHCVILQWHLGFYAKEYTPTQRGYKSHYGYWQGCGDYYDHTYEDGSVRTIVTIIYYYNIG